MENKEKMLLEISLYEIDSKQTGVNIYIPPDMEDDKWKFTISAVVQVIRDMMRTPLADLKGKATPPPSKIEIIRG